MKTKLTYILLLIVAFGLSACEQKEEPVNPAQSQPQAPAPAPEPAPAPLPVPEPTSAPEPAASTMEELENSAREAGDALDQKIQEIMQSAPQPAGNAAEPDEPANNP